ncbi:MAG: HipA domain-containing protein [Bacteroidia bacterium]|nr:HipA domain-containing protein [Bacteroidia bacterium]
MNCLLCYKPLKNNDIDYHEKCISSAFGLKQMPVIDIDENKLTKYAKEIVKANTSITGVQPKLSLWLEESKKAIRFTIVDDKSNYIIKPQSETYISLPENEDLCMHLAKEFGIKTAVHGLVRLPSGKLAYITKRFERNGENKLACEDLCQLTETLTEHKYRGSYEKTGKTIHQFSSQPGFDMLRYFELVLFSFITHNADMHLKNFSMLEYEDGTFSLSPAYDLISTALVIKNESEQMGLTLNGKRNKITKKDFDVLGKTLSLSEKQISNCYQTFIKKRKDALWWIENSFLPRAQKSLFKDLISKRIKLLSI